MNKSIKLSDLNEFICCPVCQGYLIEATTVSECLHTFCKSCIVKHIKSNHNECPKCNTLIHERRPLDYIIYDRNKQDIVYKLVPQLYITELNQKIANQELHGIEPITRLILKKKFLHVTLVQRIKGSTNSDPAQSQAPATKNHIYLKCPITVKVCHLRKLLAIKYQLEANDRVDLLYKGDIVNDEDHVSNLAQSLTFCLHYEISRLCTAFKLESHTDSDQMSIDDEIN